jgi:type IV pilus assembly protein PilP
MLAAWMRVASGALLLALLAACGDPTAELHDWMDTQRKNVKPKVSPLEKPRKFDPVPYAQSSAVEPFSTQKLAFAIRQESRQPNSLLASEMSRRKEPLESYPLDGLHMVGSIMRNGQYFAMLKADNLLYQVKVGDYAGQNFGRITRISETDIALREVVQDAAGEWIERTSTLQLQEQTQEKSR